MCYTLFIMTSSTFTLNCLVLGDSPPPLRAFPVHIERSLLIGDLKKIVKADLAPRLDKIPANEIVLWKVDIPVYAPNAGLCALESGEQTDVKKLGGQELPALWAIEEFFENRPPSKNIHIIVDFATRQSHRPPISVMSSLPICKSSPRNQIVSRRYEQIASWGVFY